jgi:hypothetical protein
LAKLLCRHREIGSERRLVTTEWHSPPGHYLEHVLGAIRTVPFPGTTRLLRTLDGTFRTQPVGGQERPPAGDGERLLGHLELVPFPLLHPVRLTRHPQTGQETLLTDASDPLVGAVEEIGVIGWIEPFPLEPRELRAATPPYGLVGLVRAVDLAARRHRYGLGRAPRGVGAGELGALLSYPQPGTKPVALDAAGRLVFGGREQEELAFDAARTARWALAPLRWRGSWPPSARGRAVSRRLLQGAAAAFPWRLRRQQEAATFVAHLFCEDGPARVALYASRHRVTGDQLLTTHRQEAIDLGYEEPMLVGYLVARAPVTGELGPRAAPIPWASRFGSEARRG